MQLFGTVFLTVIFLGSNVRCRTLTCLDTVCKTRRSSTDCVLPEQPVNGSYTLKDGSIPKPGGFVSEGSTLKYSCNEKNLLFLGENDNCIKGEWSPSPICIYIGDEEETTYKPTVIGGDYAKDSEFPWHVGIYLKSTSKKKPLTQVCGGTVINKSAVITAAHCFYSGGQYPLRKEMFSVAAGKLHRNWRDDRDSGAQYSEIMELHIPEAYEDIQGNYADDIAVLFLEAPFSLKNHIQDVKIDWTHSGLEVIQQGTVGTVAGWGLTEEDGIPSPELKYITLPTVPRNICKENSPQDFRRYLTHDKFCAGYLNGSSVCKGDSGGGFVLKVKEGDVSSYHLRGVVSVGPSKGSSCDSHKFTAFTSILKHIEWLRTLLQHERVVPSLTYTPDFVFPE